jgi:hypothetical protein
MPVREKLRCGFLMECSIHDAHAARRRSRPMLKVSTRESGHRDPVDGMHDVRFPPHRRAVLDQFLLGVPQTAPKIFFS